MADDSNDTFWENVNGEFLMACMILDNELADTVTSKLLKSPSREFLPPGNEPWSDVYRVTEPFETQSGQFSLFVDRSQETFLLIQAKSDELRVVSEHKLLSTLFADLFQ